MNNFLNGMILQVGRLCTLTKSPKDWYARYSKHSGGFFWKGHPSLIVPFFSMQNCEGILNFFSPSSEHHLWKKHLRSLGSNALLQQWRFWSWGWIGFAFIVTKKNWDFTVFQLSLNSGHFSIPVFAAQNLDSPSKKPKPTKDGASGSDPKLPGIEDPYHPSEGKFWRKGCLGYLLFIWDSPTQLFDMEVIMSQYKDPYKPISVI